MRKNLLSLQRLALVALFAVIGLAQSWAAPGYETITALTILNDGSGNVVTGAGMVYCSIIEGETPSYVVDTHTSAVSVVEGSSASGYKHTYYLYAKANPGYKFIGWNTTKTSKTGASGSTTEGVAYKKTHTPYSAGTQDAPKTYTMYAIFEKLDKDLDDEPTGTGAAFVSAVVKGTEGLSFAEGSMTSKPTVNITFAEDINYTGAAEYGKLNNCINAEATKFVTVTCKETGKALSSSDFSINASATYVSGTGDMGEEDWVPGHYENGVGTIQLPVNIAQGTYTIHLPYGLYATKGIIGVSGACDIIVTVTEAQKLPMVVKETSPAEGYEWDAFEGSGSTANNDYDGIPGMVTVIFDQPIGEVVAGKTPTLVKKDNNHSFKCLNYSKAILQTAQAKATLNVSFQQIPSGEYVCTIPAGIVKSQTGVENDEIVINFSVKANNYQFDEWALSEYTTKSATPSDGSSVDVLDKIVVSFSRDGFAAPVAIKGNPVVSFLDYVEDWSKVDPNAAEGKPVVKTTDLNLASTLSVEDGKVVITLDKAYKSADNQVVMVTIPADIVYNVVGGENMTAQELCEANAAKSPAMTLKFNLNAVATAIKNINAAANNNVMFNLAGQRVNNVKGIVVMNGKKVVK